MLPVLLFFAGYCMAQQADFKKFQLKTKAVIRTVAVLNDSTVWFAGSNGCYGYTEDNGKSWHVDSTRINAFKPEFRSMAVTNDHTIFMLNAGWPSYLLRSDDKGKNWNEVYSNQGKDVFFDSMKFRDEKNGIAVGDPVDGCFIIIITHDGGETWQQVDCAVLPKAEHDEASFSSSNTCVDVFKDDIWIATGGGSARVLHSPDVGKQWRAYATPIVSGETMTGIFSMDFYDQRHGFIAGGNYDKKNINLKTKAATHNGGKKWNLVADGQPPGFGSCVQYQPGSKAKTLIIAGLPGIYMSNDGGKHWIELKDESGNPVTDAYYTFQFSPTGNVVWFAGKNGLLARMILR
jgi:photosystem II stability/assembly factor-like uncharacterized protein